MHAAVSRVLRPLVVALALLAIATPAQAQTITLPVMGTFYRDQPIRGPGQLPHWISRSDCLAEDNIYFTVTLAVYSGLTLQVWAANQGVDCTPPEQRQGTAAQCWNVYSAPATLQITTVKIKATDIVARVLPGTTPPSTDIRDICTSSSAPKGQQLSLMFMFVTSGTQIAGTPQTWTDIGYDIAPPAPPTGVTASPGETRLHMTWTQNADGDTFAYNFYCDPPPGSVLPDGGLKPLRAFPSWGTVSQALDTGGTFGAGGFSFGAGGFSLGTGGFSLGTGGFSLGTGGFSLGTGGFSLDTGGFSGALGSGGFGGIISSGGIAGAVSAGGSAGTSTGSGGTPTSSCNASSVLLPGLDPTYPNSLGSYICGSVSGIGISTSGTVENLANDVQYAVAMSAVDQIGNVGVLSGQACGTPANVTDFFELYRAAGGKGGGGLCALSRVPGRAAAGVVTAAGLLAFAGALRRARRRRK